MTEINKITTEIYYLCALLFGTGEMEYIDPIKELLKQLAAKHYVRIEQVQPIDQIRALKEFRENKRGIKLSISKLYYSLNQ